MVVPVVVTVMVSIVVTMMFTSVLSAMLSMSLTRFVKNRFAGERFTGTRTRFDVIERFLARWAITESGIDGFGEWLGLQCVLAIEGLLVGACKATARFLMIETRMHFLHGLNLFHVGMRLEVRIFRMHVRKLVVVDLFVGKIVIEFGTRLHARRIELFLERR